MFPSLSSDRLKSWLKIFVEETNSYVYGTHHKRMVRRNQSVVKYLNRDSNFEYGSVKYFVQIPASIHASAVNIAIIEPFQLKGEYDASSFIHPVEPQLNEVKCIHVQNIVSVCIYVNTGSSSYICFAPNQCDRD